MNERGGKSIRNIEFDVAVVGGGATGLGVAYDAALRGLRTVLFEKSDFASGASSASTKLLHGGVRYLEKAVLELDYGQYKLVKQALRERDLLIRLAPHIAHYLPIVTPVYSAKEKFYYRTGLRTYDAIAGTRPSIRSQSLNAQQTLSALPLLSERLQNKKLFGGVKYFDGQFHDARMAVSIAKSARAAGAVLFNYAEVSDLEFDGKRWEIRVFDGVLDSEYTVRAKTLVNATGPYADRIRLKVSRTHARLKPSKGIHIFTDKLRIHAGFLVPKTADGRVVFCLPWEGKTMIGTTDDFTETMDYRVEEREIEYLLGEVNRYLCEPLSVKDVTGTMAGYRPLVLKSSKTSRSEALIRDHEVEVIKEKKAVHVLGGKWTTFRFMAEDAVNRLFTLLEKPFVKCQTAGRSFHDSIEPETYFRLVSRYRFLGEKTKKHLLRYGKDFEKVLDYARKDDYRLLSAERPYLSGEYEYARKYEWVECENDFYFRRLSVGLTDGVRHAETIPAV